MSLLRYSDDLHELRNRMNRVFDEGGSESRLWSPSVDVAENDREITLHVEVPGVKKDDIEIQLNGDTLTLRGERKQESQSKGEHYHRVERRYGAWQRSFQIEVPIDAEHVAASYEDGVLTVSLPKQAAVQPRQIEIQVR